MYNEIKGAITVTDKKFAIIVSQFNMLITKELLNAAVETLVRHGVKDSDIDVIWVSGSFELAGTAKQVLSREIHDAIICLGVVIKGETDHYDFIASNTTSSIASLGTTSTIPVLFGVLTTDTVEQALNRAGVKLGNTGASVATSAIEMISVYEQIQSLS